MDEQSISKVNNDRIKSRQIDELVGLARGLIADNVITQSEVEFLQKWLVANNEINDHQIVKTLYTRINEILADGIVDEDEKIELLDTLEQFASRDFELGEILKSTTLPLCEPAPALTFANKIYCFTGTFNYGQRKHCEAEVIKRGGIVGRLTKKTQILVIGEYATGSWKHSSFGNKILKAIELRDNGIPISIVSEQHWHSFL